MSLKDVNEKLEKLKKLVESLLELYEKLEIEKEREKENPQIWKDVDIMAMWMFGAKTEEKLATKSESIELYKKRHPELSKIEPFRDFEVFDSGVDNALMFVFEATRIWMKHKDD